MNEVISNHQVKISKKIGMLTLPLLDNYGGIIQAAALYGFLTSQGYDVYLIDNQRPKAWWRRLVRYVLKHVPYHNINGMRYAVKKEHLHANFFNLAIPKRTRKVYFSKDLSLVCEEFSFDVVIVGSDQVWRMDYINHDFERYFLKFIDSSKARKISYAASFGKDYWQSPETLYRIENLLSDFQSVSTREQSGVNICCSLGRSDCKQVLDPTLLVGRNFYNKFINSSEQSLQKVFLTYTLDENEKKKKIICSVHDLLGHDYSLRELGLDSWKTVPEWISEFYNADFILTDSYHGMVFSILFNKRFIALGNAERGLSRFTSLLNSLGLESRLVSDESISGAASIVNKAINYSMVNKKLEGMRCESAGYLLGAIDTKSLKKYEDSCLDKA